MRLIASVLLVAGAACSNGEVTAVCPDAAVCGGACPTTLAGNFAEATSSPASCATLASGMLGFSIASARIGSPIAVSIDLGSTAMTGAYSSETTTAWDVVAARSIANGGCVYSAGSDVVPTGSFTLAMTATEPSPHGTLDVVLYVHALDGTDCGAGDIETLDVVF